LSGLPDTPAQDDAGLETPGILPGPEDDAALPAHTPDELRRALGRFATGVTIITCRDASGAPMGLTANSFNALSLHPPLVLWSLRVESPSAQAFAGASHFAVNVLSAEQVALSRRFARPQRGDRFDEGEWRDGLGGAPVLAGSVAVFECRRRSHQVEGDHLLFIGEVERLREDEVPPLVYQGGHYRAVGGPL
jgi:3-hydroxy-9,10-secoandrosta-1,3,5(10)-triene-9,17-dione monooxygenase reductase component